MADKKKLIGHLSYAVAMSRERAAAAREALRDGNFGGAVRQFQKASEEIGEARGMVWFAEELDLFTDRELGGYESRIEKAEANVERLGDSIWDLMDK